MERNKMIIYGVAGVGVLVGGYFVLTRFITPGFQKVTKGLTEGFGGAAKKAIGQGAENIPLLGKKESQAAVAELRDRVSPSQSHSAPTQPAKSQILPTASKASLNTKGLSRGAEPVRQSRYQPPTAFRRGLMANPNQSPVTSRPAVGKGTLGTFLEKSQARDQTTRRNAYAPSRGSRVTRPATIVPRRTRGLLGMR